MRTRLTELLGIKYPLIQGPMAWATESKLAIAVGEAGGAGIIACGGRETAWVREEVNRVRKATDKTFGLNLVMMDENREDICKVAQEEKVPFVTLSAGNPLPYIEPLKKAGIKVLCVVPSLRLAKRVEDNGADAIIIEGMEAGGHIGTLTTMALLTQIIPEIKIPVMAAGGIADGRGLAAALLMGAEGVQIGTAFLVAEECQIHQSSKQRLLQAVDTDSVVTGLTRGHAVRSLKNSFTEKYLHLERSGAPIEELDRLASGTLRLAFEEGDIEKGSIQAGQSLTLLKEIKPARLIIEGIVKDAAELLKNAPRLVQ